jgi:bifunctional lysine-specific demethylase and histidyl-hydroxylase NO66
MEAGDCLYIPRGWIHDAETIDEEPSLHVTVGLLTKTWADLMLEAVSEVALRTPAFRKSLPPNFMHKDASMEDMESYFEGLLESFRKEAKFGESFELFLLEFVRSRPAVVRGGVVSASEIIGDTDSFTKRQNVQFLIRETDKDCVVIAAGGELLFDLAIRPALEKIDAGDSVKLQDFSDLGNKQALDSLKRLIAFGLMTKTER